MRRRRIVRACYYDTLVKCSPVPSQHCHLTSPGFFQGPSHSLDELREDHHPSSSFSRIGGVEDAHTAFYPGLRRRSKSIFALDSRNRSVVAFNGITDSEIIADQFLSLFNISPTKLASERYSLYTLQPSNAQLITNINKIKFDSMIAQQDSIFNIFYKVTFHT